MKRQTGSTSSCPGERSRSRPRFGRLRPAFACASPLLLVPQWRWLQPLGDLVGGGRQSLPHSPAGPALVGFRPFPDQQSLRIPLLFGLGLHPHPAPG